MKRVSWHSLVLGRGKKEGQGKLPSPPQRTACDSELLLGWLGAVGGATALALARVLAVATVVAGLAAALALAGVLALTSVLFFYLLVALLVLILPLVLTPERDPHPGNHRPTLTTSP